MKMVIDGRKLIQLRQQLTLTQMQLSERAGVGVATIKRIESLKQPSQHHRHVAERLAKAFGVEVAELAKPPSTNGDADPRQFGFREIRLPLRGTTLLAFDAVASVYGISLRSQIEMAPLFTALLAEACLAWRRERNAEIRDQAQLLSVQGTGHFAFAQAADRIRECADAEDASIARKDIFGRFLPEDSLEFGYDLDETNPFADYLADLASKVALTTLELHPGRGFDTKEGLPEYEVPEELLDEISGGDADARFGLTHGFVRLGDVPQDLLAAHRKAERARWVKDRIPPDALEEHREFIRDLDTAVSGVPTGHAGSNSGTDGGENSDG